MFIYDFLTLTVSAVVVLAAFLDPGRKLTNSLTARQAERIVQVRGPMGVPVPGAPVVHTTLCLSLGEGRNDIYLYMAYVLHQLLMFRFFNQILPCQRV